MTHLEFVFLLKNEFRVCFFFVVDANDINFHHSISSGRLAAKGATHLLLPPLSFLFPRLLYRQKFVGKAWGRFHEFSDNRVVVVIDIMWMYHDSPIVYSSFLKK
jgi:hypothetical protein